MLLFIDTGFILKGKLSRSDYTGSFSKGEMLLLF